MSVFFYIYYDTFILFNTCLFICISSSGNEGRVYEFIVRHFLACCSKDAQGHETVVDIDINGEKVQPAVKI